MSSPSRKRMRLSSPTFDIFDEDEEFLQELDRIELTLSQVVRREVEMKQERERELEQERERERTRTTSSGSLDLFSSQKSSRSSQAPRHTKMSPRAKQRRMKAIMDALKETDGSGAEGVIDTDVIQRNDVGLGFKPAGNVANADAEVDVTGFAAATGLDIFTGFQTASLSSKEPLGFATAKLAMTDPTGSKTVKPMVLKPSEEALKRASLKLHEWSKEDEAEAYKAPSSPQSPAKSKNLASASRPVLASIANTQTRPTSPTKGKPEQVRSFSTPFVNRTSKSTGVFKSPLMKNSPTSMSNLGGTVSTPHRPHPLASTPISGSVSTPTRPTKPRSKPAFSTPFKPGMGPGEPGRAALERSQTTPAKIPAKKPSRRGRGTIVLV
jgi:hypothetical protein